MFCKKCGKEINDDAVICIYCGCSVKNEVEKSQNDTPKTAIGVVMALFLGLIGLIIGVCIFPANTVARKTFMKGWLITFFVSMAVVVLFYVILIAALL